MNRFKKELRKAGTRLECDYPYLPYDLGSMSIDSIVVNSELCTVTTYYMSVTQIDYYDKNMNIYKQDFE